MAYVPVPLTCQLTMVYNYIGYIVTNGYSFLAEEEWTASNCNEFGELAIETWAEQMAPIFTTNFSIIKANVRALVTDTAPSIDVFPAEATAGTRATAGGTLPAQTNVVVKLSTANRGRRGRGR